MYSKVTIPESGHYKKLKNVYHHYHYYSHHNNLCYQSEYHGGVQPASDISTSEGSVDVVFTTGYIGHGRGQLGDGWRQGLPLSTVVVQQCRAAPNILAQRVRQLAI